MWVKKLLSCSHSRPLLKGVVRGKVGHVVYQISGGKVLRVQLVQVPKRDSYTCTHCICSYNNLNKQYISYI